jgi:hypothetical protein
MDKAKALAASWGRSFSASCIAVYMAGITDPKAIAYAGLSSVLPVILRYINPKDKSFGVTGE